MFQTINFKFDEHGQKWRRMGNMTWYTNIPLKKYREEIPLTFIPMDYFETEICADFNSAARSTGN